jgi:hypothetical protein
MKERHSLACIICFLPVDLRAGIGDGKLTFSLVFEVRLSEPAK